jgi:hypothetical protein
LETGKLFLRKGKEEFLLQHFLILLNKDVCLQFIYL